MSRQKFWWMLALVAACGGLASAGETTELSPENFTAVHRLIRPQAGESLWLVVPWRTSIWEARREAAAAGKPILIWSGGGAAPIGGC